jgi:hypothetical protein
MGRLLLVHRLPHCCFVYSIQEHNQAIRLKSCEGGWSIGAHTLHEGAICTSDLEVVASHCHYGQPWRKNTVVVCVFIINPFGRGSRSHKFYCTYILVSG